MKALIIKDLSHPARELERKEMERVAGGMIDTGHRPPPQQDDGVTWVPEGTIKIFLGGVQQN